MPLPQTAEEGEAINISEEDFDEYFRYVKKQREQYRWLLESILTGVPTIGGMASPYRELSLKEIKERARELLNDPR